MSDLTPSHRRWAIVSWSLGIGVCALDNTMSAVSVPAIAHAFRASPSTAIWITNAGQIAAAVSVLPMSSMADSIGFRRIFLGALTAFALGSMMAMLAVSPEMLILGRVVGGCGVGCMFGIVGGYLRAVYSPELLGLGLSRNAALTSLAAAIGPLVAATVLSLTSWRILFAICGLLATAALAIAYKHTPVTAGKPHRWDIPSSALNAAIFILFIPSVHALSGDMRLPALAGIAAAVAAAFFFVRRQLAVPSPMLGVDLLKFPPIAMGVLTLVICFCAQQMTWVTLPFLLFGSGASEQLFVLSAWPLGGFFVAPIVGRLVGRYPAGLLGGAGMIVFGCGVMATALAPIGASPWSLCWRIFLCGVGFGLFNPPNLHAIIGGAPPHRVGAASGLNTAFRLLAQATGASLVAVIFGIAGNGRVTHASITIALATAGGIAILGGATSFFRIHALRQTS